MLAYTQLARILLTIALPFLLGPTGCWLLSRDVSESASNRVIAVNITGNDNISTQVILSMTETRPGMEFDKGLIYDDVSRLAESGLLRNIRPEIQQTMKGVVVTFRVTEFPSTIEEVAFLHARHTPQQELRDLTPIICEGAPLNPTHNKKACFAIQDYLKNKGRYWANVTLPEGASLADRRVIFDITEGPIVRVRSIKFLANRRLGNPIEMLRRIESTAESDVNAAIFHEPQVEQDVYRLENHLRSHGFRSAKVERELIFNGELSRVDVIFHMDERPRRRTKTMDLPLDGFAPQLIIIAFTAEKAKRAEEPAENPFDLPEKLPLAVRAALADHDDANLALALASLHEPARHGGTREQQDWYIRILAHAAAKSREPLVRLRAIGALGKYQDLRAVQALVAAFHARPPFNSRINSKVKLQALTALADTRSDAAKQLLLNASWPSFSTSGMVEQQASNDERLAALRGLANFQGLDVAERLVNILETDRNVAVRIRAHLTLKAITGKEVPQNADAWRKELNTLGRVTGPG